MICLSNSLTVERAVLPDIAFPPPGEGEIEEDILEQILPEEDRSVSRPWKD
jgi:hypothetical protein